VQIVQPPQQALEVADVVHIGADGKTIENGVLVPEVVDHQRQSSPVRLLWSAAG